MWKQKIELQVATAQNLYDICDYEGSVEVITPLIANRKRPPIQALDRRAAAYIGLQDLPAALRDARKAMRLYQTGVEGYVRAAQVLCLMNKQQAASKICREGLRNVPDDSNSCKILNDLRNQVVAADSSKCVTDPLASLPLEIIEMVLLHLSFREVILMMSVSKTWKHIIETLPRLWCNLDLSAARLQVKLQFIERCIQRSHGALAHVTWKQMKKAEFNRSRSMTYQKGLKLLIDQCQLQCLRLQSPKHQGYLQMQALQDIANVATLKTLILERSYPISNWGISLILKRCKTLEIAEFHATTIYRRMFQAWPICPQLKAIVMNRFLDHGACRHSVPRRAPAGVGLYQSAPNLRRVELRDWQSIEWSELGFDTLANLEMLSLDGSYPNGFPLLPRSLKSLILEFRQDLPASHTTHIIEAQLNNLQALLIAEWPREPDLLQAILTPSRGKLRVFGMLDGKDSSTTFNSVLEDGLLENVEVLFLSYGLEALSMESLAKHMPALYEMHVCHRKITVAKLEALIMGKKGTPLRKLVSYHQDGIPTEEVEYAQANGVTVASKRSPIRVLRTSVFFPDKLPEEDEMVESFRTTIKNLNLVDGL